MALISEQILWFTTNATLIEVIALETRKRRSNRRGRLWAAALAATLACALLLGGVAQAAPATGAPIVPNEASPKPVVTIQGNIVVDKGKPTGFYELALCVRTARIVRDKTTKVVVADQVYVDALNAAAEGDEDALPNFFAAYEVQRFPFQSAAATVHIDLDALTAVTWGAGKPVYDDWIPAAGASKGSGTYVNKNTGYPRGLDLSGTVEQPDIFTDLDKIINGTAASVRLDTANPDEMTNATALIEGYDAANNTALLTLSANTTNTANVVYDVDTPVVVVRFAYDLERFRETDVLTQPNQSDFWLGLDRNDPSTTGPNATGQRALTFLGRGSMGDYSDSDAQAAAASIHQTVWYTHNLLNDQVGQSSTNFYSYLGAETFADQGTGTYTIIDNNAVVTPAPSLTVPKTQGNAVLAKHSDDWLTTGEPDAGKSYSFFQNLLTMKEGTLKLELVNAETYRKPAGGGGTTILFYDWDDSLIGSLVVDKGDIRAEVNSYVEKNMVHPDLRASQYLKNGKVPELTDPNRANYENLLNSLERQYTYRGKYPFEVGGSQTQNDPSDTSVLDGSEYPLTNKLDYAFYRRINRVTEDVAADHAQTNYYSTSSLLEEQNLDAALYPYAYCWAVVEDTSELNQSRWQVRRDATKLENTWTTVGVGELADMKPGVGRTDTAIPAAAGTQTVVEPAFIAAETEKNPVPPPTDYQFTTASTAANRYLRFADFSDIDAELERYQKETGGRKDTLIVKAVYEPGESLLTNIAYRLYKDPTYNKLNNLAASRGGAYSAEITMERASNDTGYVQGVTRVRQPAVRQDTTVDQKWIQDNALGVSHNLENANIQTAKGLAETTFTRVDVDNGDIVKFTLSLSARQNKVDYFIIEQFGNNFVSGAQRSQTNYDRTGTARTIDNYNYFRDGDSDENDIYFDVKLYEEREGSHGFVLYGTLNNLMQIATEYNQGSITETRLYQVVNYSNMRDAHICSDSAGTVATANKEDELRNKILDAAKLCKAVHYGDPDFWNSDLDCAELNYHQLQWYIIDGTLRDRVTADGLKLPFCHLHAACAELVSDKPKDWESLVKVVQDNNADAIDQMSLTEIENISHLRSSASGGAFGNVTAFKNRFKQAVEAGNTSWVDIQAAMLGGSGDINTFWWYDGATSNTAPANLAALGQAAQSALHAQTYPDGTTATTLAKLESARAAFNQNAAADTSGDGINKVSKVAPAWVRMTNNLVKAHHEDEVGEGDDAETIYTHTKFTDFEEFRTAYLATLAALENEYYGYGEGLTAPSWETIQYHMLTGKFESNFDNMPPELLQETAEFWWKDGKTPLRVSSIGTLLKAAQYVNSGTEEEKLLGQAALAKVTLEMLKGEPYYLRATIKGGELDDVASGGYADIDAFLTDLKAAQAAGATDWYSLQYYLIHKKIDDVDDMNRENKYYWWRNGGTGTAIDFSTTDLDRKITKLIEAALRASVFGDPATKRSVEEQKDGKGTYFEFIRWTPSDPNKGSPPITQASNISGYTDTDILLQTGSSLAAFMRQHTGGSSSDIYTIPAVTWHQAQYWILEGKYLDMTSESALDVIKEYWWYDKDEKPEEKPPAPDPTLLVLAKAELYANGTGKTVDVTADEWTPMNIIVPNKDGTKGTKVTSLIQAKGNMKKLVDEAKKNPAYFSGGKLNITWAQIQYYFSTILSSTKKGLLVSDAEAWTALAAKGWTAKDVPEGVVIPDGVF